jgi:hypothetical protein
MSMLQRYNQIRDREHKNPLELVYMVGAIAVLSVMALHIFLMQGIFGPDWKPRTK